MITTFSYRAYGETGLEQSGLIEAPNIDDARRQLANAGLLIATLEPVKKSWTELEFGRSNDKVKTKDVAWLARTLASTEQAGLPLFSALGLIQRQRSSDGIGKIVGDVRTRIAEGQTLSSSFRQHESELGDLAVSLVSVGEASGTLGESFAQLASVTEANVRIRRQVKAAMAYPVGVMCLSFFIVGGMLVFVVPTFKTMYAEAGATLPGITQLLITASETLTKPRSLLVVALFVTTVVMMFKSLRQRRGYKIRMDSLKLRMPVVGKLLLKIGVARFSAALSAMLRSGQGVLEALELSARASGNAGLEAATLRARDRVAAGSSLSQAFAPEPLFDGMLPGLIAVGEESGNIDEMLTRYAKIAEEEAETTVGAFASFVEPLLIVFLGLMLGAVVIALYLPMFDIAKVAGNA